MKYIVERASKKSYDKPCDNSYLEKLYNPHINEGQYTPVWFIEIDEIKTLMDFIEVNGQCVISYKHFIHKDYPSILIYDDYIG